MHHNILSLLSFAFLFCTPALAAVKPYINSTVDVRTECKTCPRSLCPNQLYYDYYDPVNVTCWTHGTKIMGDNLWLKSTAGCYITQYDIAEYAGDYTADLAYCGKDSERQQLTIEDATTKFKTECKICPETTCDIRAYLMEDTDIELTCWTPSGSVIIDDPYWMKTTNNCYVAQKNLYSKPDITHLDNCGPVPFLEDINHNNENGTSDPNKKRSTNPHLVPAPLSEPNSIGAKYLINVTVGEEYSYCRSCADKTCEVEKVYTFDQEVWLQCLTYGRNDTTIIWGQTFDFCYTLTTDYWQSPEGDYYVMPDCKSFENGYPSGNDDPNSCAGRPNCTG